MLKIGKTNRSPEERAIELSKSTNMPTPFIVAYEELVSDCSLVEKLIHEELQAKGLRINDSREFFSIPLKEAIRLTASIAAHVRDSSPALIEPTEAIDNDDSSSALHYLNKGISAFTGTEDTLQDYRVARECFERALALGENRACYWLAMQHLSGNGCAKSTDKALKLLRQGGEAGDIECFSVMWSIYSGQMAADDFIHAGNAEICYGWYLDKAKKNASSTTLIEYLDHSYDALTQTYTERFPLSAFPGKHFFRTIEILSLRAKAAIKKIRHARILELGTQDNSQSIDGWEDLFFLELFLSEKTSDGNLIMKRILEGMEIADIEAFFFGGKKSEDYVSRYLKYLSPSVEPISSFEETTQSSLTSRVSGFFRKLLG